MSNENNYPNETKENTITDELKQWLRALVICLITVLVVKNFVFSMFLVKGSSMEPTFFHSDVVFVSRLNYNFSLPEQGDIVICNALLGKNDENIIKRVVGVPGDVIDLQLEGSEYVLYINGESFAEDYILEPIQQKGDMEYPYTVEQGTYFVMGDNRNASNDSRFKSIGAITKKNITGKVIVRLYPFNKIKFY